MGVGRDPASEDEDADPGRRIDRAEGGALVVVGEDRRGVLAGQGSAARAVLRHPDAVAVAASVEGDRFAENGWAPTRERRLGKHGPWEASGAGHRGDNEGGHQRGQRSEDALSVAATGCVR